MIERIRYFVKEGAKNIWVNRMMSVASILVLTVCLLLLGTSLLLSLNMRSLMQQMEKQNQIAVFLKDGIDQPTMDSIGAQLKKLPDVDSVTFVSKEQALEQQKKSLGKNASILQGLESDNPLPNAYNVTLDSMTRYAQVVKDIQKIQGVDTINEHSGVAEKLNSISGALNWVGFWLFVILGVVSVFIISYTIKLAVFVRRKEVNIMKFVGATDWFIRWPFFVEGLLIGLLSGLVSAVLEWYLYEGLLGRLFSSLSIIAHPLAYGSVAGLLTGGFIGFGVLLGALGSLISVRKYLRV